MRSNLMSTNHRRIQKLIQKVITITLQILSCHKSINNSNHFSIFELSMHSYIKKEMTFGMCLADHAFKLPPSIAQEILEVKNVE